MTQQEQKQFTATLQLIVPQVLDKISSLYGFSSSMAIKLLYHSNLYEDLERESSKLWHLSPLALAQLWHEEYTTGRINYPEEA